MNSHFVLRGVGKFSLAMFILLAVKDTSLAQ